MLHKCLIFASESFFVDKLNKMLHVLTCLIIALYLNSIRTCINVNSRL